MGTVRVEPAAVASSAGDVQRRASAP